MVYDKQTSRAQVAGEDGQIRVGGGISVLAGAREGPRGTEVSRSALAKGMGTAGLPALERWRILLKKNLKKDEMIKMIKNEW